MKDLSSTEMPVIKKQPEITKKRNIPEPFVIPWEDGEEFKLTEGYLKHFVTATVAKLGDCKFYTSVKELKGDFLTIRAYKKEVNYEITVQISREHLSIVGGCHGNSKKLCKQAYVAIKSFLKPGYSDLYFKEFYYPEMLALGEHFYKFFHFGKKWWGNHYQMLPHPDYGVSVARNLKLYGQSA